MGQPAYDHNAVRRRRAPQPQRKANLRVAKGGKRRLNPLQAAVHNAMNLVAAALLVGFAISLQLGEDLALLRGDQQGDRTGQLFFLAVLVVALGVGVGVIAAVGGHRDDLHILQLRRDHGGTLLFVIRCDHRDDVPALQLAG